MRTTLTLDDDIADYLRRQCEEEGRPFKEIVNRTLRFGISQSTAPASRPKISTRPRAMGLRPGIDPDRMNQLTDELEVDDYLRKASRDDSAGH